MQKAEGPLRVLLSAYACEPGKGSEPGVGWNVARELSARVELTVMTRANNRGNIESSGEPWIHDVHWVYWDPPRWMTFWKKGGRGVQLFYILWQMGVKSVAEEILAAREIDLIHHITFGKYWIPSRLAALPRPFVFGPVGGGECGPPQLSSHGGWKARISELSKSTACRMVALLPGCRKLYRSAAWTFAATRQTEDALKNLGVSKLGILPQSGIRPEDLPSWDASEIPPTTPPTDELQLVTASRLIHWKAIDLAIEAAALANQRTRVRLTVLQTGPEMENLKSLAHKLGMADQVDFKGRLPRLEDVYQEIARADALVHPALHEAFGQACLESLALGVPVICLNWGGPGLIVDPTCGFAVHPGTRDETVERLAQAMVDLAVERRNGLLSSDACKARAYEIFHWENLGEALMKKYTEINAR